MIEGREVRGKGKELEQPLHDELKGEMSLTWQAVNIQTRTLSAHAHTCPHLSSASTITPTLLTEPEFRETSPAPGCGT